MIDETLPGALDGERLDRVIAMFDGCSRAEATRLVESGAVTVDGEVVTQKSYRVAEGMRVAFEPTEPSDDDPVADADVAFEVVHADADVIVVDKPAGLVVHPGSGHPDATLVNGLIARFPDVAGVGQPGRPGIVHRLDADTSGVLVVARSATAYDRLVDALRRRDVQRVYTAVVRGHLDDDRGTIDAPIGRSSRHRTKMAVVADGRDARTDYEVVDRSTIEPATLLRCELETGRTHQIRVHLSAIDHPVLGDTVYGPRTGHALISRVALHARQLAFDHPISGTPMRFEAALPADLAGLCEALRLVEAERS